MPPTRARWIQFTLHLPHVQLATLSSNSVAFLTHTSATLTPIVWLFPRGSNVCCIALVATEHRLICRFVELQAAAGNSLPCYTSGLLSFHNSPSLLGVSCACTADRCLISSIKLFPTARWSGNRHSPPALLSLWNEGLLWLDLPVVREIFRYPYLAARSALSIMGTYYFRSADFVPNPIGFPTCFSKFLTIILVLYPLSRLQYLGLLLNFWFHTHAVPDRTCLTDPVLRRRIASNPH